MTVTAGGNDLDLIGSIPRLGVANRLRSTSWVRILGDAIGGSIPQASPENVERTAAGLRRIAEAVHKRAPQARILFVGYLTLVGDKTVFSPDTPFDPAERASIRELGSRLSGAFAAASDATDAAAHRRIHQSEACS